MNDLNNKLDYTIFLFWLTACIMFASHLFKRKKKANRYFCLSFIYETRYAGGNQIGFSNATAIAKDYPNREAILSWIVGSIFEKDNKIVSQNKICILSMVEITEQDYNDWNKTGSE